MTGDDTAAIFEILRKNPWLRPTNVLVPSGEGGDMDIVRQHWGVEGTSIPQSEWNLDSRMDRKADCILICNTFMCSTDPALWLRNLAVVAPYAVVQDLAVTMREPPKYTSPGTGDVARYSVSSHGIIGVTDEDAQPVFDFSTSDAKIIDAMGYMPLDSRRFCKFVAILDLRPIANAM